MVLTVLGFSSPFISFNTISLLSKFHDPASITLSMSLLSKNLKKKRFLATSLTSTLFLTFHACRMVDLNTIRLTPLFIMTLPISHEAGSEPSYTSSSIDNSRIISSPSLKSMLHCRSIVETNWGHTPGRGSTETLETPRKRKHLLG